MRTRVHSASLNSSGGGGSAEGSFTAASPGCSCYSHSVRISGAMTIAHPKIDTHTQTGHTKATKPATRASVISADSRSLVLVDMAGSSKGENLENASTSKFSPVSFVHRASSSIVDATGDEMGH